MTATNKGVTLFDTSIATRNLGDIIIMDSVSDIISEICPTSQVFRVPTHNYLSPDSWKCLRESGINFVGGTNLLSSNMPFYQQWKINPLDLWFAQSTVLMGVGWWRYQKTPNWYTKWLLKKITNGDFFHSVRDNYTKSMLNRIGINNVINTACPTMWNLTPDHCSSIPTTRADSVVYTLTDYRKDPESDLRVIKLLRDLYTKVYFWPQGSRDISYFESIGASAMIDVQLAPRVDIYNELLDQQDVDYVGTRLHAGIRAMQKMRRTIILAVDNRAAEKGKDFGLCVVQRDDMESIAEKIKSEWRTKLNLNFEGIENWKRQFS